MENLGDKKTVKRFIIEIDGDDYELEGSGGIPGPNTVGTEQIIDSSVMEEDLNSQVKDRMTITHDSTTGGLRIGGYAKPGEVPVVSADLEVSTEN